MDIDMAHVREAQATRLATLREEASDRPAHRDYLELLLKSPTEVPPDAPKGVSAKVAAALQEDLDWIRSELAPQQQYPAEYSNLRLSQARAASQRARTKADPFSNLRL